MVGPLSNQYPRSLLDSLVTSLLRASLSSATFTSYNRFVRNYVQFCNIYFQECQAFPSSHVMLTQYIAYLFLKGYSPSTIATHMSAISFVHKANSLNDPTNNFLIKKILKGAHNIRGSVDCRLPITKDILTRLISSIPYVVSNCDNQLLITAMFLLAFYAFLRVGEITVKSSSESSAVLQFENLSFEWDNASLLGMSIILVHYKHSDLHPKTIFIPRQCNNQACPVYALYKYVKAFNHTKGPLFQFKCGTPISRSFFNSVLRSAVSFIGLDNRFYKGHSFRIGAATSAAARGVPLSVIQNMGRWKSDAFLKYIRMHNF